MKPILSLSAAILAAFAVGGCASDTDSANPVADDEIVAKVLAKSARVYEDRLEFPKPVFSADLRARIDRYRAAREAGQTNEDVENVILVGDRGEGAAADDGEIKDGVGNPYGYIRRALSWRDEGDTTIIMTEVASLEEAFAEFSTNGMVESGPAPKDLGVARQALAKKIPFKLTPKKLDGKEIFRQDGASLTIETGSVAVDAEVDFAVDVGAFRVKNARLVVGGDIDAEMVMHVLNKGPLDYSIEKEVFHKRYRLVGVGPVSLSMDVVAAVACDVKAGGDLDARGGLAIKAAAFEGGATYEKGNGIKPVFKVPTFQPQVRTPEVAFEKGKANATCTLRPKLQVLLFDRPGPAMTPVIDVKLVASTPPLAATLTAAMSGRIAGKLSVFGKTLGSIDKELPSIERELWSYGPKPNNP